MKKVISLLLTVILLLCSFSFIMPAYAADFTEADLDLSQYTMDDLMNMSAEEYRALLRDFERVYDPFGTYETDPIMAEEEQEPQIAPRWASGDIKNGEYTEEGSHEIISAQALNVLVNDQGVFTDSALEVLVVCLTISLASLLPDTKEVGFLFAGHFYHAIDGDNYLGSTSNTALTNCTSHFNQAVSAAKAGNMDVAYEQIGWALHYIQDAGEPHHAANIVNIPLIKTAHEDFETYVDDRIDTYINLISSAYGFNANYSYAIARRNSVGYFVKGTATMAYNYRNMVNNASDTSQWNSVARVTVPNSVAFSAFLLFKFFFAAGIPLS